MSITLKHKVRTWPQKCERFVEVSLLNVGENVFWGNMNPIVGERAEVFKGYCRFAANDFELVAIKRLRFGINGPECRQVSICDARKLWSP